MWKGLGTPRFAISSGDRRSDGNREHEIIHTKDELLEQADHLHLLLASPCHHLGHLTEDELTIFVFFD